MGCREISASVGLSAATENRTCRRVLSITTASEASRRFLYFNYNCAERVSTGDHQLVRGACRNVNDVSLGNGLRLSFLNATSLGFAVALAFRVYNGPARNQSCFSLGHNKDVIILCVYFGSAARSPDGKFDCVRFVVAECSSAAARSFRRLNKTSELPLPENTSVLLSANE